MQDSNPPATFTVLDDTNQIELYRYTTIITALRLEIDTGARHSTNAPFRAAKRLTGAKSRKKALAGMLELLKKTQHGTGI